MLTGFAMTLHFAAFCFGSGAVRRHRFLRLQHLHSHNFSSNVGHCQSNSNVSVMHFGHVSSSNSGFSARNFDNFAYFSGQYAAAWRQDVSIWALALVAVLATLPNLTAHLSETYPLFAACAPPMPSFAFVVAYCVTTEALYLDAPSAPCRQPNSFTFFA